MLKITDPFNYDSTTVARYKNAKLQAELIIVTSPFSPKAFYDSYSNKKVDRRIDSFGQLNRRLSLILEITKNQLIELKYDKISESYFQINNRSNIYLRKTKPNSISIDEAFKNIGKIDNKNAHGITMTKSNDDKCQDNSETV